MCQSFLASRFLLLDSSSSLQQRNNEVPGHCTCAWSISSQWSDKLWERDGMKWGQKESILAQRHVLGFPPATSLSPGGHYNERATQHTQTEADSLTRTYTLSVAFSQKWGQNKQQRVGMGTGVCWPLGSLWSSSSELTRSKEWPRRSGLHKDKQSKSTQHCPLILQLKTHQLTRSGCIRLSAL